MSLALAVDMAGEATRVAADVRRVFCGGDDVAGCDCDCGEGRGGDWAPGLERRVRPGAALVERRCLCRRQAERVEKRTVTGAVKPSEATSMETGANQGQQRTFGQGGQSGSMFPQGAASWFGGWVVGDRAPKGQQNERLVNTSAAVLDPPFVQSGLYRCQIPLITVVVSSSLGAQANGAGLSPSRATPAPAQEASWWPLPPWLVQHRANSSPCSGKRGLAPGWRAAADVPLQRAS